MATRGAARKQAPEQKVREKLYAAAAEVFARKGYAAASVQEIVQKAGVTKPVLYYYFGSKEGIYQAILDTTLKDFDRRVDAVETMKGSAAARLRRLCLGIFSLMQEHLEVIRLMHSIYYGPPQGAPFFDFDRPLFRLHAMVEKIIREGVRGGEFQGSPQAMTLAVLGVCNECIDLELVHPDMAVDEAQFEKVLEVVLRGMEKKDGRK